MRWPGRRRTRPPQHTWACSRCEGKDRVLGFSSDGGVVLFMVGGHSKSAQDVHKG